MGFPPQNSLIPETLRVCGSAQIVRDDDLREQFLINDKLPQLLIAVDVEEVFFHCTKCVVRSNLWSGEAVSALDDELPSLAQAVVKHANLDVSVEEIQTLLDKDEIEGLY